jgi:hypothetical protein
VAGATLVSGGDHVLGLSLKGASVSVSVDGAFAVSWGFNSALVDGGLGAYVSSGTSSFDWFRIRTNDPAFAAPAGGTPVITVADTRVTEGDSGTKTLLVTLQLSAASTTPVTVGWATADGTATAGSDYVAGSGTRHVRGGSDDRELHGDDQRRHHVERTRPSRSSCRTPPARRSSARARR